jgi:phosphoglycolate phosphatase
MTARIRGLLFDKDGTLLDYHASWMPLNRAIALHAARGDAALASRLLIHGGYDLASERIRADTPLAAGTPEDIAACFGELLSPSPQPDLAAEVNRMFHEGGVKSVLVPDAAAAISRLRKRASFLGIATSDSMAGLKASLGGHGLLSNFDFLAAFDSGHGLKPGPGMALAFCEACGLSPDEIAVIGDNRHDMDMGRAAKAALVIGVLTGTSTEADFAGHADRIYPGIAEMAADHDFIVRLG